MINKDYKNNKKQTVAIGEEDEAFRSVHDPYNWRHISPVAPLNVWEEEIDKIVAGWRVDVSHSQTMRLVHWSYLVE